MSIAFNVNRNLAFLRPCAQSTTHKYIRDKRAYPRAEIAVDGVTEGDGMMEQTSITENEKSPWWQVDLERDCQIRRISIYDRTDIEANAGQQLKVTGNQRGNR